jgi:hypothetical protein
MDCSGDLPKGFGGNQSPLLRPAAKGGAATTPSGPLQPPTKGVKGLRELLRSLVG